MANHNTNFKILYSGSNWGMGCNSIHFLDLFAYLSKTKNIKKYYYNLDKKFYSSKRKGYIEFKGILKFEIDNSSLVLEDSLKFKKKIFQIISNTKIYSFNKNEDIVIEKNMKNNSIKKYKCEKPYVSNITYKTVKKLINNKTTELTGFKESIHYHQILINIFSKQSRLINSNKNFMIT